MNNMNTSCVVRTTDVMEDYISQMDPDGEYLEHAFNLANARNWAQRQGHKYSDRVWNAAKGGWNYVYDNTAGALALRSRANRNLGIANSSAYSKQFKKAAYRQGTIDKAAYNRTALGRAETNLRRVTKNPGRAVGSLMTKARTALNRAKAGISSGMKRGGQFARNLRSIPSKMTYNKNSEYYKSGAAAQQNPSRMTAIRNANNGLNTVQRDYMEYKSQKDYSTNRDSMMSGGMNRKKRLK